MVGFQGRGYKFDIVFVIDATRNMAPIMTSVKERVLKLGDEIVAGLVAAGKYVEQLRVRVIDYADYITEGEEAIRQSRFFKMPQDRAAFTNSVYGIDCDRRGITAPLSNGLEALFAAMCSDWVKLTPRVDKGRHIIVLITDNYPLHLMERKDCAGYPEDELPPNVKELQNVWNENDWDECKISALSKLNERLILVAPDGDDGRGHSWSDVQGWDNTTGKAVDPATGLKGVSLDSMIIAEIIRGC